MKSQISLSTVAKYCNCLNIIPGLLTVNNSLLISNSISKWWCKAPKWDTGCLIFRMHGIHWLVIDWLSSFCSCMCITIDWLLLKPANWCLHWPVGNQNEHFPQRLNSKLYIEPVLFVSNLERNSLQAASQNGHGKKNWDCSVRPQNKTTLCTIAVSRQMG